MGARVERRSLQDVDWDRRACGALDGLRHRQVSARCRRCQHLHGNDGVVGIHRGDTKIGFRRVHARVVMIMDRRSVIMPGIALLRMHVEIH